MAVADRRAAVTKGVEAGLSERRSCRLVGLERKTFRYRSRRPQRECLRARLRELAEERVRWGYRRLHVLLRRDWFADLDVARSMIEEWRKGLHPSEAAQLTGKPDAERVRSGAQHSAQVRGISILRWWQQGEQVNRDSQSPGSTGAFGVNSKAPNWMAA